MGSGQVQILSVKGSLSGVPEVPQVPDNGVLEPCGTSGTRSGGLFGEKFFQRRENSGTLATP